jgi:hypothetical protein
MRFHLNLFAGSQARRTQAIQSSTTPDAAQLPGNTTYRAQLGLKSVERALYQLAGGCPRHWTGWPPIGRARSTITLVLTAEPRTAQAHSRQTSPWDWTARLERQQARDCMPATRPSGTDRVTRICCIQHHQTNADDARQHSKDRTTAQAQNWSARTSDHACTCTGELERA